MITVCLGDASLEHIIDIGHTVVACLEGCVLAYLQLGSAGRFADRITKAIFETFRFVREARIYLLGQVVFAGPKFLEMIYLTVLGFDAEILVALVTVRKDGHREQNRKQS